MVPQSRQCEEQVGWLSKGAGYHDPDNLPGLTAGVRKKAFTEPFSRSNEILPGVDEPEGSDI